MTQPKKSVFPPWEGVFDMSASEMTMGLILSLTGYPNGEGVLDRLVLFLDRRYPDFRVRERFAHRLVETVKPLIESWVPLTTGVLSVVMNPEGTFGESMRGMSPEDAWDRLFRHLSETYGSPTRTSLVGMFAVSAAFSAVRGEYGDAITGATNALRESHASELSRHGRIRSLSNAVERDRASVLAETFGEILNGRDGTPTPVRKVRRFGRDFRIRLATQESREEYHWHYLLALPDEYVTPGRVIDEFRKVNPMSGIRDIAEMASYFDRHVRGFRRRFAMGLFDRHIGPIWECAVRDGELRLDGELSMIVFVPEEYERRFGDGRSERSRSSDFLYESLMEAFRRSHPGLTMDSLPGRLVRSRLELSRDRYDTALKIATSVLWQCLRDTDGNGAYFRTEGVKAELLAEAIRCRSFA